MKPVVLAFAAVLLCGCASSNSGGVFGWWAARGERDVAAVEGKRKEVSSEILTSAQQRVQEAVVALLTAPPSRPVEVASEAANQASALLAQVNGPLTVAQLASVRQQVEALLSDNAALRAEGERLRYASRAADAESSRKFTELTKKLQDADDRASAIAADNARLAGRYLAAKWAAGAMAALSVAASIAAWAYRANFMGVATGAGEMLGTLRARYGVKDDDLRDLIPLIDAPTTPSAQKRIADIAAKTAAALLAPK